MSEEREEESLQSSGDGPLLFQTNLMPSFCYKDLNIKMHNIGNDLCVCVCVCVPLFIVFCRSEWDFSGKAEGCSCEDRTDQKCAYFFYCFFTGVEGFC